MVRRVSPQSNRRWLLTIFLSMFSCLIILAIATANTNGNDNDNDSDNDDRPSVLSPWQRCSVFVAPTIVTKNRKSGNNSMNWGVYANRDFSEGEIVDISPLTVPIPDGSESIERSVLNDYVYGYWRVFEHKSNNNPQLKGKHSLSKLYSVLFGPDMFYNHHPVAPNVEFFTFGREPEEGLLDAVNPQGFVAIRRIRRGEEIFTSYNGKEDGGAEWFRRRGIPMETPSVSSSSLLSPLVAGEDYNNNNNNNNNNNILENHSEEFCSKIYSGVGLPSWRDRLLPLLPKDYDLPFFIDHKWLAPSFDAGWGDARTKVGVKKGGRLEISTALVLSHEFTKGSALMPLVYAWKDLHEDHREGLRGLAGKGHLHLQYQGPDTSWKPKNNFTTHDNNKNSFEDLVLFPVAGNIGMVRRRTTTSDDNSSYAAGAEANCRLILHPSDMGGPPKNIDVTNNHSTLWLDQPVGVTIELVATKDMAAGTVLVVDLMESVATPYEYKLLLRELKSTGQPFAREAFRNLRHNGREQTERTNDGHSRSTTTTTKSSREEL